MKTLLLTILVIVCLALGAFAGYIICVLNQESHVDLITDLMDDETNMYKQAQERYFRTMQELHAMLASGREEDAKDLVSAELRVYGIFGSATDGESSR